MKNPMLPYTYCRPDYCEDSRYGFKSVWDADNLENLAEDAAEDFHNGHDGWESQWPLTFNIYDAEGERLLGTCTVEREHNPTFAASKIEAPATTD